MAGRAAAIGRPPNGHPGPPSRHAGFVHPRRRARSAGWRRVEAAAASQYRQTTPAGHAAQAKSNLYDTSVSDTSRRRDCSYQPISPHRQDLRPTVFAPTEVRPRLPHRSRSRGAVFGEGRDHRPSDSRRSTRSSSAPRNLASTPATGDTSRDPAATMASRSAQSFVRLKNALKTARS